MAFTDNDDAVYRAQIARENFVVWRECYRSVQGGGVRVVQCHIGIDTAADGECGLVITQRDAFA